MPRNVKQDGRTTRWDDHREQRRVELVEAAVAAIDRHGPDASVAEMAAEAGVSKPVLYRYFADKDELHAAVGMWGAQLVLDRIIEALRSSTSVRDRVAAGVDAYLASIEEHPQVFLLLVRHHDGGDPLAGGKAAVATTFARVLGDMLRDLGVDAAGAEPWAHGLVGLGVSVGDWWIERRTMSREAVARYLTGFIWHAFAGMVGEHGVPLTALDSTGGDTGAVTPLREGRTRA